MKNIKYLILIFAFLLFFPLKVNASATIEKVEPSTFIMGETVTIIGSGFGSSATQGQVCWGSDKCVPDSSIKSWSNTEIVFLMNVKGMDSVGSLKIAYFDSCAYKVNGFCFQDWNIITGQLVSVTPYINTLKTDKKTYDLYNGEFAHLKERESIELTGEYFGDAQGNVYLGDQKAFITSWSNERIICILPDVEKASSVVTIRNAYASSKPYNASLNNTYTSDPYIYEQVYLTWMKYWEFWKDSKYRGQGITVAVIDSGVNWNHEDFIGQIAFNTDEIPNNGIDDDKNGYIDDYYGYNFLHNTGDPNPLDGHGSLVAGIIAAKGSNGIGIEGIAPEAKIMPLIACDETECNTDAIIKAINYAIDNGAKIINLSLGGNGYAYDYSDVYDEPIKRAYEKGITIVVAAGNGDYLSKGVAYYGRNLNNAPNSPVCNDGKYNYVIGVASIEYDKTKSPYSDYGDKCIDISAYGTDVFSLSHPAFSANQTAYDSSSGTSMAAPQVSGAVAILLSKNPDLTPWEIREFLKNSGDEINGVTEYKNQISTGLNIQSLLSYVPQKSVLPKMIITSAEVKDNNLFVYGEYFAENTTLVVNYLIDGKTTSTSFKNTFVSSGIMKLPLKSFNVKNITERKIDIDFRRYDEDKNSLKGFIIPEETLTNIKIEKPFPDVEITNINLKAITYLKEKLILQGYPDGTFKPENPVNRAELVKILVAQTITPDIKDYHDCFPDVKRQWFAPYVCYAKSLNWIAGYPDGNFKPEQPVNKAEALKIFLNAKNIQLPLALYAKPYDDVNVTDWFAPYIFKAKDLEILEEQGPNFMPSDPMKRAGISEILYRLLMLK